MRRLATGDLERIGSALRSDPEVDAAYVFGSAVRDVTSPQDLDLAILLADPGRSDPVEIALRCAGAVERALGTGPVDVRILDHAPLEFRHRVLAAGRCVLARDPVRRIRFEADTLVEYLDFVDIRDEYDAALRRRVRREAAAWSMPAGSTGTSSS